MSVIGNWNVNRLCQHWIIVSPVQRGRKRRLQRCTTAEVPGTTHGRKHGAVSGTWSGADPPAVNADTASESRTFPQTWGALRASRYPEEEPRDSTSSGWEESLLYFSNSKQNLPGWRPFSQACNTIHISNRTERLLVIHSSTTDPSR